MASVSVVIPAFNAEHVLGDALRSVVEQTVPPLEIIVVDDGSRDGTARVARSFSSVKYLFQENSGPSRARNVGIAEASGDYVAFLDADDLWLPHKLARQLELVGRYPDVGVVCTNVRFLKDGLLSPPMFETQGLDEGWFGHGELVSNQVEKLLDTNFINTSAVAVRRDLLDQAAFNEQRKHNEDWELWLKLARLARVAHVDEVCVHERQFGGSLSSDQSKMLLAQVEVFEEFIGDAAGMDPYRQRLKEMYKWVGYHFMTAGDGAAARSFFRKSLNARFDLKTVLYYLKTLVQGYLT